MKRGNAFGSFSATSDDPGNGSLTEQRGFESEVSGGGSNRERPTFGSYHQENFSPYEDEKTNQSTCNPQSTRGPEQFQQQPNGISSNRWTNTANPPPSTAPKPRTVPKLTYYVPPSNLPLLSNEHSSENESLDHMPESERSNARPASTSSLPHQPPWASYSQQNRQSRQHYSSLTTPSPGGTLPKSGTLSRRTKLDRDQYEFHTVTIKRDPVQGLGFALAGGRDNPQTKTGDTSLLVSDVVPHSPSHGLLKMNDRLLSVNGTPTFDMLHSEAASLLKNSGNNVTMEVARAKPVVRKATAANVITLSKTKASEGFGLELSSRYFVSSISPDSPAARDGRLQNNTAICKINGIYLHAIPFLEARNMLRHSTTNQLELTVDPEFTSQSGAANKSMLDDTDSIRIETFSSLQASPDSLLNQSARSDVFNERADEGGFQTFADKSLVAMTTHSLEPRVIQLLGGGGLGLKLLGGNVTGTFVSQVKPGTQAYNQGLVPGDELLKIDGNLAKSLTREEVLQTLAAKKGAFEIVVRYNRDTFLRLPASGRGDSFYIKSHFHYKSTDAGDLNFDRGDILKVVDSMAPGKIGHYVAVKIGANKQELQRGIIPNSIRANEIQMTNQFSHTGHKSRLRSGSLSRLSMRGRSRSSSSLTRQSRRAQWEDESVDEGTLKRQNSSKSIGRQSFSVTAKPRNCLMIGPDCELPGYERVIYQPVEFVRPVILFGAISDLVWQRLVDERADIFEAPDSDHTQGVTQKSVVNLAEVEHVMAKKKHCLLSVTPATVDWLNYKGFYPIVLFLRANSRQQVKDTRAFISGRAKNEQGTKTKKLYELGMETEKFFKHIFTATIPMTTNEIWFKNVLEMIEKQQKSSVWISLDKVVQTPSPSMPHYPGAVKMVDESLYPGGEMAQTPQDYTPFSESGGEYQMESNQTSTHTGKYRDSQDHSNECSIQQQQQYTSTQGYLDNNLALESIYNSATPENPYIDQWGASANLTSTNQINQNKLRAHDDSWSASQVRPAQYNNSSNNSMVPESNQTDATRSPWGQPYWNSAQIGQPNSSQ